MTRMFTFLIICTATFSCTKNTAPGKSFDPSHAIIITGGVLHYDNFPDGWGLYYETDSNTSLIFKYYQGNDSSFYNHFKPYVGVRTQLSYQNSGETGCLHGFGTVCGIALVDVVDLKNE